MSNADIVSLLNTVLSRLDLIESKIGGDITTSSTKSESELPKSVKGFDAYLASYLDPFVNAANKLGGDATIVGTLTKEAWNELRTIILKAAACKEPKQAELPALLATLGAKVKEISASVKRNEWEKHTKTVSEG